jgi:regulatory protein
MDEREKAFASALRSLARRDHSVAELERKLDARGFAAEVVSQVIDRLTAAGYLDDRRFARQWAESAVRNGRGYGPRLMQELNLRGVPRDIVSEVVAGISAAYGEDEILARILARKYSGFDPRTASDRDKRRVIAYLQRRGFSLAAIFSFMRRHPDN